jgi:RNA polymerase sigma-70 factor (ECF subfamily)
MWQSAREAWPDIHVDPARYQAFVAAQAVDGDLEPLKAADLYLACALGDGDQRAVAAFERTHLTALRALLTRAGSSADNVDETLQRVRVEVLVGSPPGILGYRGRSDLHAWLRVVATREAARVERRARREVLGADEAIWADLASSDPELAYIKDVYRQSAVLALRSALAALPAEDLALFRQNLVEGLSIDEIGARAGVHRATAARRLERARERVAAAMRAEIEARLRIDEAAIDELLQLVRSRLDVSVRRVLQISG